MAITWIAGNKLLTFISNSNPDMPGITRSERRISGFWWRISRNAECPSSAHRTEYPNDSRTSDIEVRIHSLSSTTRTDFPLGSKTHLGTRLIWELVRV